jgi:hypothetical protein
MTMRHLRYSLWLPLALTASAAAAQGPAPAGSTPAMVCTTPADFSTTQLFGLWQLSLWPEGGSAEQPYGTGALLFERHPEYAGSVRGRLKRSTQGNDRQALVSGDVTDGAFNLDESADGVTMDAVWEGSPMDCGREIRGLRRPAEGNAAVEPAMNFLLRKAPGWR